MYNDLQGKVAAVTGSSRGIGAAVVSRLVAEGMNVVINYHSDEEEAQSLADDLNKLNLGKAIIFGGDISNEDVAHNFIYCAI
ncbi:SDR family NAD(P)-dependent oxidoreductase, partial [Proteus columbae]|uniref:SDR family NAD(P)-dependent oxidoreductase n=2 Tax=Gammaproteobacteria TaxID=1236 RepID=UPI00200B105D